MRCRIMQAGVFNINPKSTLTIQLLRIWSKVKRSVRLLSPISGLMDPVTVAGFVAALVQLIDVTSKVVNYCNDVKDAPKDRAKLSREVSSLLALFIDLRYRVEETTSTDPWFTGLRALGQKGGPLTQFKAAMEDIADKLEPGKGAKKIKKFLCWTLDKKDIEAILSRIERLKKIVTFALQQDHFKLSLAIKDELTEMKTNRDAEKILQWLAAPDPSLNHNSARKKKQEGTEDLISCYQSEPTVAVAYFYFDFNETEKQRTEMLIRSLIIQFAERSPHFPDSLQSAYSRSHGGQKQPTTEELTDVLCHMLNNFNTTYILLDALDECADREDLLEFIETLMGWKMKSLHVLTTSRKENDIVKALESLVICQLCIQSALVDNDIHLHILERLSNDKKLMKWHDDIKKEIEDALMEGAKGMFRWVVCQLDSLQKCLMPSALRKTLKSLPHTLDETYERILSNIDEDHEEYALRVFRWLCFSARPMQLDEMVEVLATGSTVGSCFRPDDRFVNPHDILTICSTLISVTATSNGTSTPNTNTQELRLAHYSVKEYLISDRLKKTSMHRYHIAPLSANIFVATTCLTYLLYFESSTILTAEFEDEFPLARYAAEFWPLHYRNIKDDADREAVDSLGFSLVESKTSCFINWLRIFDPCNNSGRGTANLDLKPDDVSSSLYYMSYFGVTGVVRLLLNKKAVVNVECGFNGNVLSAASSRGHLEVVQLLLEKGAEVNAECGHYGNALLAASLKGNLEVARLLLEKGAEVNAQDGAFWGNALSAASFGGNLEVAQLLLEKGAEVNAQGGAHGNALSGASFGGDLEVVRLLLEKGAEVNAQGGHYSNALSGASFGGDLEVVRLLLEKGAEVNAQGGHFGNALSGASFRGKLEVVRLLLEKGAEVNAQGGEFGNALLGASFGCELEVVRLLLEKGAEVNAQQDGEYGNALSAASYSGHLEVVRLLLEKGAEVNAQGGEYGNALTAASSRGHLEVVRLLLEKGAEVNAHGGRALSEATQTGQKIVMRILLENGAKASLALQESCEVLDGISIDDYEAIIQVLLEELQIRADASRASSDSELEDSDAEMGNAGDSDAESSDAEAEDIGSEDSDAEDSDAEGSDAEAEDSDAGDSD
ncbi:hypothetical protein MMC07_001065 [Pseudocyphellaria aurata]|nr:hypothetical protein [Pseudocyphellaria aurata]